MLFEWLLKTPAWADLSAVDRAVYVELKRRYTGQNNGAIVCGFRELASALGLSKDTAGRALRSLEDHGFIALAKRSGFNVKNRAAQEWLLTEAKDDRNGHLPLKTFAKWRPEEKSTVAPQGHTVALQGQATPKRRAFDG